MRHKALRAPCRSLARLSSLISRRLCWIRGSPRNSPAASSRCWQPPARSSAGPVDGWTAAQLRRAPAASRGLL